MNVLYIHDNEMSQHEETLSFLQTISHTVYHVARFKYESWTFYTTELGKSVLNRLESKTGTTQIRNLGMSQDQLVEEYYHYQYHSDDTRIINIVENLSSFVDKYKTDILFSDECQEKTKATIEKLEKLIGRHTSIVGSEWGWYIRAKKLFLKIYVDVYKDPEAPVIRLETLANPEKSSSIWQKKIIKQKQLWTFINKYKEVIQDTTKPEKEKMKDSDIVTEKMSHLKLEHNPNTTDFAIRNRSECKTKYANIFIQHSKEKRIAYQTCKPVEDKFKYLMDLD